MSSEHDESWVLSEEEVELSLYPGQPPRRYRLRMIADPYPKPRHITGVLPEGYLDYGHLAVIPPRRRRPGPGSPDTEEQ